MKTNQIDVTQDDGYDGHTHTYEPPDTLKLEAARALNAELLAALKAMVASYDGLRCGLTSPLVISKLAAADAAIAKAEAL